MSANVKAIYYESIKFPIFHIKLSFLDLKLLWTLSCMSELVAHRCCKYGCRVTFLDRVIAPTYRCFMALFPCMVYGMVRLALALFH